MPRTQINEASVFQVCDEVYISTGKDPTYEDVRNVLGGSFSTIKPYLQSWLDKPRPPRFALPEAIGIKAAHLAQVIWGYAVADARQLIEVRAQKFDAALALKQNELDIAMQEIRSLETERDRFAASVDSLVTERAELRVRLEGLQSLASQLQESQAAERAMRDARDQAREEANIGRGQIQALEGHIAQLLQTSQEQYVTRRRSRKGNSPNAGPAN